MMMLSGVGEVAEHEDDADVFGGGGCRCEQLSSNLVTDWLARARA